MPRRSVVVSLAVLVLTVGVIAPPAGAAADDLPVVRYRPPVDGPIVDHFDLPAQRWQAGNRGIDYDVGDGTPVRAAAAGEVVFAGPVAGALHVTVLHADGLRTSYSFLAATSVHAGQRVSVGQQVGVAGGPVHVGVRTPDGTYLDPELLFAGVLEPQVRLVPGAEDGLDPLAERRSLLDAFLDTGAAALGYAGDHGGDWYRLAAHYATELDPRTHLLRASEAAVDWVRQRFDCTDGSAPVPAPPERRIAVVVSGLGTGSDSNSAWEFDTAALGYDDADVVRYSYAGGRAPGPGVPVAAATRVGAGDPSGAEGLERIPVHEFTARDSQADLAVSAARLEDLLVEVGEAEPGVPIDVIAHSQGGVVSRLAVVRAGAEDRLPSQVENLVTVGSPHQGAPLATGAVALQQTPGGALALAGLRASGGFPELDDRLPAIGQLAETSSVLQGMRDLPIPDGVRFTSLGAGGDLIVPGPATADPQADGHVILPTAPSRDAHGALPSDPRTTREVTLAVSGAPPTCQGLADAVVAFGEGELIRTGEAAGALAAQTVALGALESAAGAVVAGD